MKIKSILADVFLFVLFYAAVISAGVTVYTYFNFGIVSIDKFLSVFNEVFYLDWAVKKIKIYSAILLVVAFLGVYFLRPKHIIILSILLFLLQIFEFDMISYYRYKNTTTTFYEENYVAPKIEKKVKNNLIIVYLESFEDQYITKEISPFLAKLKEENISFDGFKQVSETFSTIHAQFASLCGISLSQNNTLTGDGYINFLPNIKCIPDLLKENGYSTAYLKAADLKFSRANYFVEQHNFDVAKGFFELENKAKIIRKDYKGNEFGGLKDRVLFEVAKDEILKLKEPFFVALTTLDTHGAPDVYYDPDCEKKFNDIRDAIHCTGQSVEHFVNWLEKQPFWKNTTLLIMGDHQMSSKLFSKSQIFNVFINPVVSTNKKTREFTTYDFSASVLDAIGYNVAEFGIGRSLFRDNKTLFEKEGSNFHLLVASKSELYEKFRKFNHVNVASYKNYELGQSLDNTKLFNYSDFGEKNTWCNGITYLSMTLNKIPKKDLYLKMNYLKGAQPFKIFANNTLIFENVPAKKEKLKQEQETFIIPESAFNGQNKLTIKIDSSINDVNKVFTLCVKEFILDEKK